MNVDASPYTSTTKLLNLPNETLMYIFEFLKFEEVAKYRIVCKRVDEICQKILNRGFQRAAHQHAATYKRIKSLLPRRESERRYHAFARHADILTSIETRISMLSMTYTKYIDLNMCCFIPGKVLDEIFHILRLTMQSTIPLRPLEILQEFRDISSMAIEHFDEKIASEFKKLIERNSFPKAHSNVIGTVNRFHDRGRQLTNIGDLEHSDVLVFTRCSASDQNSPKRTVKTTGLAALSHLLRQPSGARKQRTNIKKLQRCVMTLQKKNIQLKKHLNFFIRKVNGLTTQHNTMKRRLDELDSKNQELIGTIRQYNTEESQTETANNNATARPTSELNANANETNTNVPTSVKELEEVPNLSDESNKELHKMNTSSDSERQTARVIKRPFGDFEDVVVCKKQKNEDIFY